LVISRPLGCVWSHRRCGRSLTRFRHSPYCIYNVGYALDHETSEDRAYSHIGIFAVNCHCCTGRLQDLIRLQEKILKESEAKSLFAWICLDREGPSRRPSNPDITQSEASSTRYQSAECLDYCEFYADLLVRSAESSVQFPLGHRKEQQRERNECLYRRKAASLWFGATLCREKYLRFKISLLVSQNHLIVGVLDVSPKRAETSY